jgi:hypothetical protein
VYLSVRPSVFHRWVFFLFATDLATEMRVTNGRGPSVRPSVIISPTDFIPVTDRISPSVKLFNGVVTCLGNNQSILFSNDLYRSIKGRDCPIIYIYIYMNKINNISATW